MEKKMYDVYFKIDGEAVICVEANSKEEAEDYVDAEVDKDEILRRLSDALDFHGLTYRAECID